MQVLAGIPCTKSPAPLAILCAFPTGFFGWDIYFIFFFPLSTEVRGSCARNALGISTLRSRVNGSSCRGAAEMLARGLLAQLRLSFRCAKGARWDSSSSEAPSEAWWGRTCGGWKAEWEASGAGELRLGSEKKK